MRKYHAPCEAGEKSEIISETYLSLFKVVNEKKGISWIKTSKPWDNPFAERGIRTIKCNNSDSFEELHTFFGMTLFISKMDYFYS
jgi:hypothetical protein